MNKTVRALSWLIPLAVMATIGVFLAVILTELDADDQAREQQHAEIVALQAGLDEANARLTEQGEPPVPVPEVEPGTDTPAPQIIIGERGFTGATGPQGRTGPPGETGPPGRPGKDGMDGRPGADGLDGEPGADGAAGADGKDGLDGLPGKDGVDGAPGKDGLPGKDGAPGTALPGTYTCPEGQFTTGFSIATDGVVTLTCADMITP
jgi:hypothetical protein